MAEADPEDEDELAQWMPICDDCDNPVEHYCTTCGDKLCTGCKDSHLFRRKNRDHRVVPYSEGMKAAQKSTSTCSKHPGQKYQMYCKTCRIPVCTPCVTQSHSGHAFSSIPDAFSFAKGKAISSLEELTKTIRPRVKDECKKATTSEAEALEKIDSVEKELRSRSKLLYEMVDVSFRENMKQLTIIKEKTTMPVLQKQQKESNDKLRHVEKIIKDYEDNLRSDDPIHLISFMNERDSEDLQLVFPALRMNEIPLPKFEAVSLSQEIIQSQFGSVTLTKSQTQEATGDKSTSSREEGSTDKIEKDSIDKTTKELVKSTKVSLGYKIMKKVEKSSTFTIKTKAFRNIFFLRQVTPDKIYVNGGRKALYLIDMDGNVLCTINVQCQMYDTSGMYCTKDEELVFCDKDGKTVKKISADFRATTLFSTGNSRPLGISQLQSGEWVVCVAEEKVLRVYDGAGNIVREIGKGHLQCPFHITVNKVNGDICVSDNLSQVVVFSSSGEKRFTYTGDGTGFNPFDLCCDQLGNILITDYINYRVHIIDRNGHFLQYLVSGKVNISWPMTIDIDDSGCALVGERKSLKVFKYLS